MHRHRFNELKLDHIKKKSDIHLLNGYKDAKDYVLENSEIWGTSD